MKTWLDYVKSRTNRIKEGTLYMMFLGEEDCPVSKEEFDKLMNFVEVLNLERKLYVEKTKMILDMFDLLLNYNPKADEVVKNQYKDNLRDKINLVRKTILCLK